LKSWKGKTISECGCIRPTLEELYLDLRAVRSPDTMDLHVGDWVTDAYLLHFKRAIF
jgi:hypothetical protein